MLKGKFSVTTILIIFIVFICVSISLFFYSKKNNTKNLSELKPVSILSDTKYFSDNELPYNFPTDLPREKSVKILENFTSQIKRTTIGDPRFSTPDLSLTSGTQSTYSFLSNKTIIENYSIYKIYFQGKKWKIGSDINTVGVAVIFADMPLGNIQFSASKDIVTGKVIVKLDQVTPELTSVNSPPVKK